MNTQQNAIRTIEAVLAVVTGMLLTSCGQNDSVMPPAQALPAAPIAVRTTRPQTRSVSRLISLPGEVHPWEEATLYAKVPGYLSRITVDKGDHVSAGQVIAVIDAPELAADRDQAQQSYQSAVAAARGSLAMNERSGAERQRSQLAAGKAKADLAQMPSTVARARALLAQTMSALVQAEEQKSLTATSFEESRSQVAKATAELESARSDQKLAELTYERYKGIYDKNPMLIARQDVDVAESRAAAAHSKVSAAEAGVEAARQHGRGAQAQVNVAASQIDQAKAQVAASQEQVNLTLAQQNSASKLAAVAEADVSIAGKQQAVSRAKSRESVFQANAGRSALGRSISFADYAHIRAPFAGVVTKRFVDRGAFIQSASASQNAAPIATVANLDQVRVFLTVPETQAHFVQAGTAVTITIAGLPDSPIKGRVSRTSASLDPKTRTLLAEVDLPNGDGAILTGSYANARIVMETHPGVVSVPTPAVGVEKAGKFVFVVVDGKAKRVPVTTGFDDGAFTEISEGLLGGEHVVVTGRDALTPNARVTPTPWVAPTKPIEK